MRTLPLLMSAVMAAGAVPTSPAATKLTGTLYSATMDKEVPYAISLPTEYNGSPQRIYPVLYGLHGQGAPYDTWTSMPPLWRAIDGEYPAIVATFEGENSFFLDFREDRNNQYTTFFFEEFVPYVESTWRAGRSAGMRAVTGFSMGGYGAWHYMLERPEFFASVSALSGGFNFTIDQQPEKNPYNRIPLYAGQEVELPPAYINCGSEDWLLPDNRNMAELMEDHGYAIEFVETPGAAHNWPFWRDTSELVIAWHYQHFREDGEPADWHGYPVADEAYAEAGSLGWLFIGTDPWVWSYRMESWLYVPESVPHIGWVFIRR